MVSIVTKYAILVVVTATSNFFCVAGITVGANLEDNTIQFPHDSCQSEIHGKFEFKTFHDANPYFDEDGNFEMLVRFRGAADGHIALTEKADASEPLYLIIFGSYNNRKTEIRRTKSAKPERKIDTPEILSSQQWRGFVIQYNSKTGHIQLFPEGIEVPLLEWNDPKPLSVAFFSFTTYHGRVLQVAFDCRANDEHSSIPKVAGEK